MAEQTLRFGNTIYLKCEGSGRLWLTGGRSDGHASVNTRDGENNTLKGYYQWYVRETNDEDNATTDEVRYGDYVYFKLKGYEGLWLSGGRGDGNTGVITKGGEGWSNTKLYQWRIRKSPSEVGSGVVRMNDKVFLQLRNDTDLYLSGGRGSAGDGCSTKDGEGWTGLVHNYTWKIDPAGYEALQAKNIQLAVNIEDFFDEIYAGGQMCKGNSTVSVTLDTQVNAHVQSMTRGGMAYYYFTHSEKTRETGYIIIVESGSNNRVQTVSTPSGNGKHPGGLQAIGEYLAVAIENAEGSTSWIRFYDCRKVTDSTAPVLLPVYVRRETKGAACCGITSYVDKTDPNAPKDRYLLGVFADGKVDFYRSDVSSGLLDNPNFKWEESFGSHSVPAGCGSLALLTDQNNNIYLITFEVDETSNGFEDYARLSLVTLPSATTELDITQKKYRKFDTQNWKSTGKIGVHFRFGAGLYIRSEREFELLASERSMQGDFAFNVFAK